MICGPESRLIAHARFFVHRQHEQAHGRVLGPHNLDQFQT